MSGLLYLTHLEVPILQLNPSKALLNLHFNSSILYIFQIPIFHSILLYGLHTVRDLFLELIYLQSRVVKLFINLLHLSTDLLIFGLKRLYDRFFVVETPLNLLISVPHVTVLLP